MRPILSILALGALLTAACATQTTYETVLDVCSSGNGTVKSANVLKTSGDPEVDKKAQEIGKAMVYEESTALVCRPVTIETRLTGGA